VLVVEGAARPVAAEPVGGGPAGAYPAGQVEVHAAAGGGDDAIVAVAAAAAGTHRTVVVTADRELAARVEDVGAATVRPSWLLRLLESAPDT
jgi:hypothetical protein